MKAREVEVTRFVKSRPMAVLLAIAALCMMLWCATAMDVPVLTADRGLALPSPDKWFSPQGNTSFTLNILTIMGCAMLMAWLNASFNILRNFSVTFVGIFLLMTATSPLEAILFQGASLLAFGVLAAMALMLSVYGSPGLTRRIFLAFAILGAGTLVQYAFVPFILVMLAGLAQMRVMTPRSLTASLLGVLTPWCLVLAFSPVEAWPCIRMPEFANIFPGWPLERTVRLWVTLAVTLGLGLVLGIMNLVKVITYNAKARAVNGLLTTVSVTAGLMSLVDFTNMPVYIILVNACTAFQTGHFFAINIARRGYIPLLLIILTYICLFFWTAAT